MAITFRGSSEAVVAVLVVMIRAWSHLGNDWLQVLPTASGQQLQEGMAPGSSWTAQNLPYIASPAKTFCFGWLRYPSTSLNFYVAVWYCGLDGSIVWVANREHPAAANDSLQFSPDGYLLLSSASSQVWKTGTDTVNSLTQQPTNPNAGVNVLRILDSGNAVLVDTDGFYTWESFLFPTDTLLPSQIFLNASTLVSRLPASPPSLALGNFKFYINGLLPSIDYTPVLSGPSVPTIWQAPSAVYVPVDAVNNSAIAAQFLINGTFCMYNLENGTIYSQFVPSDYGSTAAPNGSDAIFRRLTLDPDGNLRMYGWDSESHSWIVSSEAIPSFCSTLSLREVPVCGPYGVCVDAPKPACFCPPGFHPTDINDVTSGCTPSNVPLPACENNQSSLESSVATYLMLSNTDFFGNNISSTEASSLADCQSMCTSLCSCMGVIYDNLGAATCWLKSNLMNGYSPQTQIKGNRDAYVKLQNSTLFPFFNPPAQSPTLAWITSSTFWSQASLQMNNSTYCGSNTVSSCPPSLSQNGHRDVTKRAAYMKIAGISLGEFLCFLVVFLYVWKAKICRHGRKPSPTQLAVCRAFTYAELDEATDQFKHPLGFGAFGVVFKGFTLEGTQIAVKRLQTNVLQIADSQFRAEIATLGRIHHVNLLRLYGFCAEGPDHRLLVYEFMENGSLNMALFDEGNQQGAEISHDQRGRCLNWQTRYKICAGTARGLAYLHEECLDCIVHCDIKPENILLDREFCPRVADFGLAYLFGRDETVQVSKIRGTRGYLAPEWVTFMPITAKADVFSYGMVLVEIVTGRRNFRFTPSAMAADTWDYPKWAFREVQRGRLERVVDRRIRASVAEDEAAYREVEKVLSIAFLCLHRDADARPSMKSIVQMLEGSIPVPPLPNGLGSFQEQVEGPNLDHDDARLPQGPQFSDASSSIVGSIPIIGGR